MKSDRVRQLCDDLVGVAIDLDRLEGHSLKDANLDNMIDTLNYLICGGKAMIAVIKVLPAREEKKP